MQKVQALIAMTVGLVTALVSALSTLAVVSAGYTMGLDMTLQLLFTAIIAIGGFMGTIALLVLNLRVNGAMGELRTEVTAEMGKLQVEMANMRADTANDRANAFERVTENMSRMYLSRETQLAMHEANGKRLDNIENELKLLAVRVGDIS